MNEELFPQNRTKWDQEIDIYLTRESENVKCMYLANPKITESFSKIQN